MSEGPTRARPLPTVVRYAKVRVSVTRGPNTGLYVESAGTPVRIGTSSENDLVLTDDTVSRRHAELQPTPLGMRVRDVESTNGIVMGGVRLKDGFVTGDFQIAMGETWVAVQWLGETVDREQVQTDRFGDVLGRAPRMRELFADLERIAPSEVTLLIEGETGTGKDLIAESVHAQGGRASGPFVVFDCGAVAPTLVESALFGHVRGAFTGASQNRPGLFDVADGGTLFLDEIGEMPLAMQAKLLRVLQDGEIRPVGADRSRHVDVRLIAATHRDLEAMVVAKTFREDLFYRLNVVLLRIPPLRERTADIPLIVQRLAEKHATNRRVRFTRAALDRLVAFPWPGNVRQLENEVRRCIVLAAGDGDLVIDAADLSPEIVRGVSDAAREVGLHLRSRVDSLEKDLLEEALTKTEGNQTKAAELLGLSRFGLQKMMKRLKLTTAR